MNDQHKTEAVILVRIDDMTALETVGQRSIRFPVPDSGGTVNEVVARALAAAPPVEDWLPR